MSESSECELEDASDFFDLMDECQVENSQAKREAGPREHFMHPAVRVASIPGKGRGLVAQELIPAGTMVLSESAVATVPINHSWKDKIVITARLAAAILESGFHECCSELEPQAGFPFCQHPMKVHHAAELEDGEQIMREENPQNCDGMSSEDLQRLLLALILNCYSVEGPDHQPSQGVFPAASMANHSCCPNLIHESEFSHHTVLTLRTIVPVNPGDELCISYIGGAFTSFPERDELLRQQYGFGAMQLSTDGMLEELTESQGNTCSDTMRLVVEANSNADAAWQQLASAAGGEKKLLAERVVKHYRRLLQEPLLGECHCWRYNALIRSATLLNQQATVESCREALTLWEMSLIAGDKVWPSRLWPEQSRLLEGAITASEVIGDEIALEKHRDALNWLQRHLNPEDESGG